MDNESTIENDHLVGERVHELQDVGREHDRKAAIRETPQKLAHDETRYGVDSLERFIQHEQLRPMEQCQTERQLLAHARRGLAREHISRIAQSENVEQRTRATLDLGPAQSLDGTDHLKVLPDREPIEEREIVGHDPDAPVDLESIARAGESEDENVSARGIEQPGHDAEQSSLPRAVGAEQREEATGLDLERNPSKGFLVPKAPCDLANLDGRRTRAFRLRWRLVALRPRSRLSAFRLRWRLSAFGPRSRHALFRRRSRFGVIGLRSPLFVMRLRPRLAAIRLIGFHSPASLLAQRSDVRHVVPPVPRVKRELLM